MKVFVVHAYLEALLKLEPSSERDVIVFNDGSDVLYTPFTARHVLARYSRLEEQAKAQKRASPASSSPAADNDASTNQSQSTNNGSSGVVFFSGERQCWPYCLETNASSSFKYVSSGQWVGRTKDAVNLFRLWTYVLRLRAKNASNREWCGDQTVLHEIQLGSFFDTKENRSVSLASNSPIQAQVKSLYPSYEPVSIDVDGCHLFQNAYLTSIYSPTGVRRKRRRLIAQTGQQSHPRQKPNGDHKSQPLSKQQQQQQLNSPFYFFQNASTFGPYFSHNDGKLYNTETRTSPFVSHHPGKRERKQLYFFDMERVLFNRRKKQTYFKTCVYYFKVYHIARTQCGHLINCKE